MFEMIMSVSVRPLAKRTVQMHRHGHRCMTKATTTGICSTAGYTQHHHQQQQQQRQRQQQPMTSWYDHLGGIKRRLTSSAHYHHHRYQHHQLCCRLGCGGGTSRGFSTATQNTHHHPHKFAVAFDIDGVLLRGSELIKGAKESLHKLREQGVTFVFLTNGGGCTEAEKAAELSAKFDLDIQGQHIILSHSPMRSLTNQYKGKRVMVIGSSGKKIAEVDLGLDKIIDPYDLCYEHDPIFHFTGAKYYINRDFSHQPNRTPHANEPVEAVLVLHDPLDWAVEAQIVLDVLKGRHIPPGVGPLQEQTPFYISNPDMTFAAKYAAPRLAAGAFAEVVKALHLRVYGRECKVGLFGKPTLATFAYAQQRLEDISQQSLDRIFMVGDNPEGDIRGANKAGSPWISILVRTGLFNDGSEKVLDNDPKDPAAFVHDDVSSFVQWVLQMESGSGSGGGSGGDGGGVETASAQ